MNKKQNEIGQMLILKLLATTSFDNRIFELSINNKKYQLLLTSKRMWVFPNNVNLDPFKFPTRKAIDSIFLSDIYFKDNRLKLPKIEFVIDPSRFDILSKDLDIVSRFTDFNLSFQASFNPGYSLLKAVLVSNHDHLMLSERTRLFQIQENLSDFLYVIRLSRRSLDFFIEELYYKGVKVAESFSFKRNSLFKSKINILDNDMLFLLNKDLSSILIKQRLSTLNKFLESDCSEEGFIDTFQSVLDNE